MCRRARRPPAGFWCVLVGLAVFAPALHADDLASYLEQRGLHQLLAIHLEEQLRGLDGDDHDRVAVQLAGIYAQLLETTGNLALRVDLEERSRRLLQVVPEGSADELQLALQQGAFRAAERIAEDHRLRLSTQEEVERAIAILTETIPRLNDLRKRLKTTVQQIERRMRRASGADAAFIADEDEKYHNLLRRATFLTGWAQYYQAWLNDWPDNARVAERLFGEILDPDGGRPTVGDMSRDLLPLEPIARTVLGMALCRSLTTRPGVALDWLALLEGEESFEALRQQTPGWKLAICLENSLFRQATAILQQEQAKEEEVPLPWIRLAAVYAIEAGPTMADAVSLARLAVAELAGRGELGQVLDLAERYGADAVGTSGFAARYVRGVLVYQTAREAHGNERPTTRGALRSQYEEAARLFSSAIDEPDVDRYPLAAGGCRMLIGWSFYFRGSFLQARDAFMDAVGSLPAQEAAEALWMAIVSYDRIAEVDSSTERLAELEVLIDDFLNRFPSSEYAPRLILRRADGIREPSSEVVNELLSIPLSSDSYLGARRRAATMLYQLFRRSTGEERLRFGRDYLAVAVPFLAVDVPDDPAGNEVRLQSASIRARRILEVSLTKDIERTEAAAQAFDHLDRLVLAGVVNTPELSDELDYQRLRLNLLEGNDSDAEDIAERLWQRDESSIWARAGNRAVFRKAYRQWIDQRAEERVDLRMQLDRIVRYGGRCLREYEAEEDPLANRTAHSYYAAVAEATHAYWELGGNPEMGERALFLYSQLLDHVPSSADYLRTVAILSDEYGEGERALACWRRLSNGLQVGSNGWYEAKYRLMANLGESNPARAREVMNQFKTLQPDFGPEPWRSKLRSLDARLPGGDGDGDAASNTGGSGRGGLR